MFNYWNELLKTHQRNCHVLTLFEGGKGKEMWHAKHWEVLVTVERVPVRYIYPAESVNSWLRPLLTVSLRLAIGGVRWRHGPKRVVPWLHCQGENTFTLAFLMVRHLHVESAAWRRCGADPKIWTAPRHFHLEKLLLNCC